jgi:hypothetical protein
MNVRALTLRSAGGIVALLAAIAILIVRLHALAIAGRVEWAPRVEHLAYIRSLSARVYQYAQRYGRPVDRWNLNGYVSAAESTEVVQLRADLWHGVVHFTSDEGGYSIDWNGESQSPRFAGTRTRPNWTDASFERYDWPPGIAEYVRARRMAMAPRPSNSKRPWATGADADHQLLRANTKR